MITRCTHFTETLQPTSLAHVYFTPSSAASGHKDLHDRTFRIDDGNLCHTKR